MIKIVFCLLVLWGIVYAVTRQLKTKEKFKELNKVKEESDILDIDSEILAIRTINRDKQKRNEKKEKRLD